MNKRLEHLIIAAPCPVQWEDMEGDHRVRLCGSCSRNVYNISDMTSSEAELFLATNGDTQCLRFYRRSDGMIMTDNCPRGLRAVRDNLRISIKVAAAVLASIFSFSPFLRNQSVFAQDSKNNQASPAGQRVIGQQKAPAPAPPQPMGGAPVYIPPKDSDKIPAVKIQPKAGTEGKTNSSLKDKRGASASGQKSAAGSDAIGSDPRAYNLFAQAAANEQAGKLILAQTQYQEALKIARSQTAPPDSKLLKMIEDSLCRLRLRLKAPDGSEKGR